MLRTNQSKTTYIDNTRVIQVARARETLFLPQLFLISQSGWRAAEKPCKEIFNKCMYVCNCRQCCFGCMYACNLPLSIRVHTTLLASMCRAMPFSHLALWKIKKTLPLTLVLRWKTNRNVVYRGLHSHRRHYSFPKDLFRCWAIANVFERKVWRVQVAHLHNAARALSSPSRCFQLSTNLDRDFFRYINYCYLWYCCRNKSNVV